MGLIARLLIVYRAIRCPFEIILAGKTPTRPKLTSNKIL
jgi:hypothetical protein